MSHSLQETVENFKNVVDEMQRKVAGMKERTEEAYRKINQLEAQKYTLIGTNSQLTKELQNLSYEVAVFEESKAAQENRSQASQRKGIFRVKK